MVKRGTDEEGKRKKYQLLSGDESYMHLPGQGKVRGIDTEVLGDHVKKGRSSILHMHILKGVCTIFLQQHRYERPI